MNTAKQASKINGTEFLKSAFIAEQKVLATQLELSRSSITHDGKMGDVNEQYFIDFLRKYLPLRYEIDSGIVIDSNGATSDQIDIVIFDRQYTPTLLDQKSHRFIPAEAVYGVFEVKPKINKANLKYAAKKAASVRRLTRTSVPILQIDDTWRAKKLFPIVAGLIAINVGWTGGLSSESFKPRLSSDESLKLDCGLALSDKAFDMFDGGLKLSTTEGSLGVFLFRLLQKLQSLGTVPAIDWNRYASIFDDVVG
jgi:hypothetical protein